MYDKTSWKELVSFGVVPTRPTAWRISFIMFLYSGCSMIKYYVNYHWKLLQRVPNMSEEQSKPYRSDPDVLWNDAYASDTNQQIYKWLRNLPLKHLQKWQSPLPDSIHKSITARHMFVPFVWGCCIGKAGCCIGKWDCQVRLSRFLFLCHV